MNDVFYKQPTLHEIRTVSKRHGKQFLRAADYLARSNDLPLLNVVRILEKESDKGTPVTVMLPEEGR